jgi:hypothetical protein
VLTDVSLLAEVFSYCPYPEGEKFLAQYRRVEKQLLEDGCCLLEIRDQLEAVSASLGAFIQYTVGVLAKEAEELEEAQVDLLVVLPALKAVREGKPNLEELYRICPN